MKLKKQHKRLLYLIAAISLMGLIYYFSAQTYAEQSLIPWIEKYLSFPFIYRMIEGLEVNYGGQTLSIQTIGYAAFIEFFIRKSLHFLAFACLGFFLVSGIDRPSKVSWLENNISPFNYHRLCVL